AWVDEGLRMVKMKVGRHDATDTGRVVVARKAIGPDTKLFVDANGAYSRKEALAFAERCVDADVDVVWFEEPVTSDDLDGLRWLRWRATSDPTASAPVSGSSSSAPTPSVTSAGARDEYRRPVRGPRPRVRARRGPRG